MKLRKVLLQSFIALSVTSSFAAASEEMSVNAEHERASHFSAQENQIYQYNVSPALDRIFSETFSSSALKSKDSYRVIVKKCAFERAAIAQQCVVAGVTSHEEAQLFGLVRRDMDGGEGKAVYFTPLVIGDNEAVYKQINQKFILGEGTFDSLQTTLSYMTNKEREELSKKFDITLALLQKGKKCDELDRNFLQQNVASEAKCFNSLLMTEDTLNLFAKNLELGSSRLLGENVYTILTKGTVMATLRASVSLDAAAPIAVGSINCLARYEDEKYKYYDYFVLDHVRSQHIDALMNYAEKHWDNAIFWDRHDSSELMDSASKFFWAQTVALPYLRGSESVSKWMLTLMARYHEQEFVFSSNFAFRMPFVMSLEEFSDYFKENVFLKSELANLLD